MPAVSNTEAAVGTLGRVHVLWDILGNFALTGLYLRNLYRAQRLLSQCRILSHHLAVLFSFTGLFQALVYLTLHTLDSGCGPVVNANVVAGTIGTLSILTVLLLRTYHSHNNPRWNLFLGSLVLLANGWIGYLMVTEVMSGRADGDCMAKWPRDVLVNRFRVDMITNAYLALCFVTAEHRDGWVYAGLIIAVNSFYSVLESLARLEDFVGGMFVVNYAIVSTLSIALLDHIQRLRAASNASLAAGAVPVNYGAA